MLADILMAGYYAMSTGFPLVLMAAIVHHMPERRT